MSLSATESHASQPKLGYRRALDGLRGVAIALVVLNHTFGIPTTGITGVELFFVLSGFLITTLLLEEHELTGRVSFSNFYRRRALRLLPALVALLAAFLVYAVVSRSRRERRSALRCSGSSPGSATSRTSRSPSTTRRSRTSSGTSGRSRSRSSSTSSGHRVLFLLLKGRKRLALGVLAGAFLFTVSQQIRLALGDGDVFRIRFGTDTRMTAIIVGCALAIGLMTVAPEQARHGRTQDPPAGPRRLREPPPGLPRSGWATSRPGSSSSRSAAHACSSSRSTTARCLRGRSPSSRWSSSGRSRTRSTSGTSRSSGRSTCARFPSGWTSVALVLSFACRDRLLLPRREAVPATQEAASAQRAEAENARRRPDSGSSARSSV